MYRLVMLQASRDRLLALVERSSNGSTASQVGFVCLPRVQRRRTLSSWCQVHTVMLCAVVPGACITGDRCRDGVCHGTNELHVVPLCCQYLVVIMDSFLLEYCVEG